MGLNNLTKYICTNCGHTFRRKSPSHWYPCVKCKSKECYFEGDKRLRGFTGNIHRKPLTEWQKKKLGWYKNEKAWLQDIEGRKALPDGRTAVYDPAGKLVEIRPKGGKYYGH